MTFSDAAKICIAAKGIDQAVIYHVHELRKDPKATRNQGGGFNSSHQQIERFRVCLTGIDRVFDTDVGSPTNGQAKGGLADVENADLFTAVRQAFEILKLPPPAGIPPAPTETKKKK